MMRQKKRWLIALGCLCGIILGCSIYVNDYYVAGEQAMEVLHQEDTIQISETEEENIFFHKEGNTKGLIFYPGGKVEHLAYAPLMKCFAKKGISCVLIKMPLRLAVLDQNAAEGVQEQFPEIKTWYIGGHSLGGSMAAAYVAKQHENYDSLILLAAYSTENLRDSELKVFSCYGSKDGILDLEKYKKYQSNLPKDALELILDGGNHAGFADYEKEGVSGQKGDGVSTISNEKQMQQVVDWVFQNVK